MKDIKLKNGIVLMYERQIFDDEFGRSPAWMWQRYGYDCMLVKMYDPTKDAYIAFIQDSRAMHMIGQSLRMSLKKLLDFNKG